MKKIYQAPALEVEVYRLDASIASNCTVVVDMGPDGPGYITVCQSYYEVTEETPPNGIELSSNAYNIHNIDFWNESSCRCYYTATGDFFTS